MAVTYRDAVPPGRPERAALPLAVALAVAAAAGAAVLRSSATVATRVGGWPEAALSALGVAALIAGALAGRRLGS